MKHLIIIPLLVGICVIQVVGQANISMGTSTATGSSAFAAGDSSQAIGATSVAIGNRAIAQGDFTLSMGDQTKATGKWAQAFGFGSHAKGDYSLSSGFFNLTEAFAVGIGAANLATGGGAVAIGRNNSSLGNSSSVIGTWSHARTYGEVVLGAYAEDYTPTAVDIHEWVPTDRLFVVANGHGDGTGVGRYSNALVMLKNGNTQLNGQLKIGDNYSFPITRGLAGDILKADADGDLIWLPEGADVENSGTSNAFKVIPDNTLTEVLDTISLSGLGTISDSTEIRLCIDISHVDVDELEIYLVSPNNSEMLLHSGVGSDYSNTCFSTESTLSLTNDNSPYSGIYEAPFDNFYGDDISGIWQLKINDDGGQVVAGTLNTWNLVIQNPENQTTIESSDLSTYGFMAMNNGQSGYRANQNLEFGFESVSNGKSGYLSQLNQDHGYTAIENDLDGYYAEMNKSHGFHAFNNDLSGYYASENLNHGFFAFDNNQNGFLSTDNVIGFRATGFGLGFESTTSTGFKAVGGSLGFEANTMDGFKATGLQTGFKASNISGAIGFEANTLNGFKATPTVVGFSSTGGVTAFSSTGSAIGVNVTAPIAGQFNGDLNYTGLLNGVSDSRLKNIIDGAEEEMLSRIVQLSLHTYTFKTAENEKLNLPSGRQYGVMAQELQKIFPELVNPIELPVASQDGGLSEEKIEYLGVNHIGMVPILVKGVQELASENERLKDENLAIKDRLARLEAIILNQAE